MIGIFFTGGTISMKVDPETGAAVPAMSGQEILEKVPGLEAIAEYEAEDFSRLPGPHVSPEHMWRLARRAAAWLERPDVDGLVITHGTDTLEETAYLLDLVLLSEKPVVLVGAIRTVSEASWDGPANLLAAVRVAASPAARGRGTLVVMNQQVLLAAEAQKVHTEAAGSFAAPEFGPVGSVDGRAVRFVRSAPRPHGWRDDGADAGLRVRRIEPRVDLVKVVAGSDDRYIRCSLTGGTRGLVIEAMGRGNVPPPVRDGLAAAIAAGLPVIVTSRCGTGHVAERYGYEGGGRDLARLGAILAGRQPGIKARVKLMVALGFTTDLPALRQLFVEP